MFDYKIIDDIFADVETYVRNSGLQFTDPVPGTIDLKPAFIRDDQDAIVQGDINYPFVTYRIISDPIESSWNHIFRNISGGLENGDPNKPNNKNIREIKVRPVISINAISETVDGLDYCRLILSKVLQYFWEYDLTDAVAFINDKQIENRSTEIEGEIEYKLGFDLEIEFTESIEKISEAIRKIRIGNETETGFATVTGEKDVEKI